MRVHIMVRDKKGSSRLFYLLILLTALIIIYPILKDSPFQGVTLNSIFTFILMTFLFSYTLVILVRHIIEAKEISADLLYGAGCIYMLIGFAWSGICITMEFIRPGLLQLYHAHHAWIWRYNSPASNIAFLRNP